MKDKQKKSKNTLKSLFLINIGKTDIKRNKFITLEK